MPCRRALKSFTSLHTKSDQSIQTAIPLSVSLSLLVITSPPPEVCAVPIWEGEFLRVTTTAFANKRAAFFFSSFIAWSRFRSLANPESDEALTVAMASAPVGMRPRTRTVL